MTERDVNAGYARGRTRRAQILDHAVALFGEIGYRSASLREIAARSGISHPGLLHHFPSKEALLLAVLARRDEVDATELALQDTTGVDTLRRTVDVVALNATRPAIVELFTTLSAEATSADHPARSFFVERYRRSVASFTAAYAEARDAGALRAGVHPEIAARQLIALMDGIQVQWLLDRDGVEMAEVVRGHIRSQLIVPL